MHELGIVFHIINEIEDVGKENELKTVSSVSADCKACVEMNKPMD